MAALKKKRNTNYMRAARLASEISQAELARRAGMHPTTVSLIEAGRMIAYPVQVAKLIEALDVSEKEAARIRAQIARMP